MPNKPKKVISDALVKYVLLFLLVVLLSFLSSAAVSAKVVINELMPNPPSGSDWIELYADTDEDISGWIVSDEATTDVYTFPNGTLMETSTDKYLVIDCGSRLNKRSDTVILRDSNREVVDEYSYSEYLGSEFSFGRFPDGKEWMKCMPTYEGKNGGCEKISNNASVESSPTEAVKQDKAILEINEVRDTSDNILSNVKIYVDGNYVHHYAPETLVFCDDCNCDGYANCSLGEHKIKLERSGYVDWTDMVSLDSGETNLDPVMNVLETVTEIPTNTATETQLPTAFETQNAPVSTNSTQVHDPLVLGIQGGNSPSGIVGAQVERAEEEVEKYVEHSDSQLAAALIFAGGVIVLSAAAYPIITKNGLKLKSFTAFLKNEGEN